MTETNEGLDIAIIGMAGRFPGAKDVKAFWENLKNGVESVTLFTDEELAESGIDPNLINDPNYVKSRAIVEDEDKFDARFFDFFPREVEIMDPQHRLFLETSWLALEDAGYVADNYDGLIGLFGGVSLNTYLYSFLMNQKGMISSAEGYQLSIGNDKDFLTTRVSYKLNLTGPSVNVQTACSTSLVAIHIACQNLLNFNCDMAMAGGVSVTVPQKQGYYYQEGMILSKDGHCRAFSDDASGTISGSGVGMVVLKRLDEALEDGDHIYAVIKGSAFNNDGANRVGYTAPSVDGQSEVIANAQAISGVDADTISYIETHGTGTVIGDPIEITALSQVFSEQTKRKQFCAIGSVKTNIGHLDAAAGVAGLIKTSLSLHHKQIPASLNFRNPNPKIDFENSPFFVNTELKDWKPSGALKRAGISSFGIGGTNVHAILEEAPQIEKGDMPRDHHLILFSAKSPEALDLQCDNFANYLEQSPDTDIADAAFTLQVGRGHFTHRRMLVCSDAQDALQALKNKDAKRLMSSAHQKQPSNPPVAFMFSGQGAQYVNMGKDIYETEIVFREEVDQCCKILETHMNLDLRSIIYPQPGMEEEAQEKLNQTYITQPALFVVEYALAKFWMSCSVEPTAMVGHSIGEYVAACLSGVLSLEDALKLVAARGKLMQNMPAGAMLSVQLNESAVQKYLTDEISIAALNSEGATVLSGTFTAIEALEVKLNAESIESRRLHTSHAFHSAMMDPILETFTDLVKKTVLNEPQLPYLSNVSGTWITREQAVDPAYYATHLRQTVRFMDNAGKLLEDENLILLEVGPGTSLTTLARRHPNNSLGRLLCSSLRHPQTESNDTSFLLNTIGLMWLKGLHFDWFEFYGDERRLRLSLPGYPFERKRYWMHSGPSKAMGGAANEEAVVEGKNPDISRWFYAPSWKQSNLPFEPNPLTEKKNWLIFKDMTGLSGHAISAIEQYANRIVVVDQSSGYDQVDANTFKLRPAKEEDYTKLFDTLKQDNFEPDHILHFWNVALRYKEESFENVTKYGFKSLLYLSRNFSKFNPAKKLQLDVISKELFEITGFEKTDPAVATLLGPAKVMMQEFPNISCRTIDIMLPQSLDNKIVVLGQKLAQEFLLNRQEYALAYRGKERWIQQFEPLELNKEVPTSGYLKEKGVYVITGGMGRIGMTLANHLAMTVGARLALIENYDFPAKEDWPNLVSEKSSDDLTAIKIKRLINLEQAGAKVLVIKADMANLEEVKAAFQQINNEYGAINGVIHAAGVIGAHAFKSIPEMNEDDWKSQFQAKVFGAENLATVLQDQNLDFVLLQSSMSAVLGGLGFGAYAAANSYLDALAYTQNKKSETQWISVNWDGWNFDDADTQGSALGAEIAQLAIKPDEGIKAFERIFSYRGMTQVVVSTGNLQQRIEKWQNVASTDSEDSSSNTTSGRHERPDLPTSFVAPETDIQKQVAEVWQQLLGIEPVGIHDDFFDLGGNSLMGTQLISQMRATFQVDLPLRSLFEDPTVAGVSKIITESKEETQSSEMNKVEDLLNQMDNMSDEDIAKMLNEKKSK